MRILPDPAVVCALAIGAGFVPAPVDLASATPHLQAVAGTDDEYSPDEAERRMVAALRVAMSGPATPHSQAKLGNKHRAPPSRRGNHFGDASRSD